MPFGSHSLQIGEEAPLLTLSSSTEASSLDSLKEKYVLLNFWSASDPESRILNKHLADMTSTLSSSQIQFVSICTDQDSTLQSEIMNVDGVSDIRYSLSYSDLTPEVFHDYQTHTGCRSFLIDPFGNLKAISPSDEDITLINT